LLNFFTNFEIYLQMCKINRLIMKFKLLFITLLACFTGWGQTPNGTLDFGNITDGTSATTTNTGFGGVRVGSAGGGFTIQNPGKTIGSQGELRGIAPTSASINSVGLTSTEYGTAATTFTIAFDLHLSGGSSGIWYFFAGNGATFGSTQSTAFSGAQIFTGLRWTFGSSNAITTNNRNGGNWSTTGIANEPFAQNTDYRVIIVGNNSSSSVNYGSNSIASYKYDLWVNGVLLGNDLSKAEISNSTSINAFRFYGESSTSNVAQLALDNVVWYNSAVDLITTTYTTSWSNSAPTSSLNAIIDGDLTTSTDLACKDLTINANRTLTIAAGNKLTVSGNLINNGTILFKSNTTATAMFDVFNGTQSGSGLVTTERYIPAKRAFRFLSPSVTTSTSIKLNWQENAGTTAGLGTHITGVDGTTNGFDATSTNNPSLFTFNNSTGVWEAVTSTLTNFTAGTPYRLMVRGDRLINLSTNTPTATETVLRATGTLHTGNFSPTLNQAAEGFSFVGNPYQAPVNIKTVLDAATNMNTGVVYYWDPTLNARGGYVTRDLSANNNTPMSDFNQYLQPGQAVFVKKANTASAASVTITESHKSVANGAAGVFRTTTPNDYGLLRVNLQANTNNQWQTIEGTLALFNNNFSWNVTPEDATKMSNLDEEVSFVQNNTSLAIACVSAPSVTSELPIQMNNLRHSNYQWQFELANYQGERPYLYDTQNNTYTEITNGTTVPFTATTAAANRFKIVFQPSALNADDFTYGLVLYPNPAKAGDSFYVQGSSAAEVTVYNVLGQNIPVQVKAQGNALQVTPAQTLSQGIYLVTVTTEGKTQHVKWIVE
jgi:hypothetical protein